MITKSGAPLIERPSLFSFTCQFVKTWPIVKPGTYGGPNGTTAPTRSRNCVVVINDRHAADVWEAEAFRMQSLLMDERVAVDRLVEWLVTQHDYDEPSARALAYGMPAVAP